MNPYSIAGINALPEAKKRELFLHLIPKEIFNKFSLPDDLIDTAGNDLLTIRSDPSDAGLEFYLYHESGFDDPIMYSHMIDTLNGQIHLLLYVMNDPFSPRFDVDKMPDGSITLFATRQRNIEAELAAMAAGLLPGQIRRGLKILSEAVVSFEIFVEKMGHRMYFTQPLYYHNAIIFERYGFNYQSGKRRMEEIHRRFTEDESLIANLGSTPFRHPEARNSIFYRSWAIHDGILGEPFPDITMYKTIHKQFSIQTAPEIHW